jgi:hypothetical protein
MNQGRTVFTQFLDFLPKYDFDKCVARHHGKFRVCKADSRLFPWRVFGVPRFLLHRHVDIFLEKFLELAPTFHFYFRF